MIQNGCQSFWAIDIPIFWPQDGESTWCWNWEQLHTLIQLHTLGIFWTCGYQHLKPLVSKLEPHPYLSSLPRRPCEVSSDSRSMEEMMKGALILRQFVSFESHSCLVACRSVTEVEWQIDRQMDRRMDGWMDGWLDGWLDGWMDG